MADQGGGLASGFPGGELERVALRGEGEVRNGPARYGSLLSSSNLPRRFKIAAFPSSAAAAAIPQEIA